MNQVQRRVVRYGPHREQIADVLLPERPRGALPVAMILHGGFWKQRYTRELMLPMAEDLARRGWAAYNVEYRRVGGSGGGWPTTFLDVAAALDWIARAPRLDARNVVVIGHSAGGHLALWAAGRHRLPAGAPGHRPQVRPRTVLALAPVADLAAAIRDDLGAGAAARLLGRSVRQRRQRLPLASPVELLPLGVQQVVVHGRRDRTVPTQMSRGFVARARAAGDRVRLVELDASHMDLIDVRSPAWTRSRRFLRRTGQS